MKKVNLGDLVKDPITGIEGVVIAITEWIAGCRRITIQPRSKKGSSEKVTEITCDEPVLKIIKKGEVKVPNAVESDKPKMGGPLPIKISRY